MDAPRTSSEFVLYQECTSLPQLPLFLFSPLSSKISHSLFCPLLPDTRVGLPGAGLPGAGLPGVATRYSREGLQSNISLSVENGQVAKYKGSSSTYLNFKKMGELFSPNIHLKKQCIGNKSLLHSVCHYRLP